MNLFKRLSAAALVALLSVSTVVVASPASQGRNFPKAGDRYTPQWQSKSQNPSIDAWKAPVKISSRNAVAPDAVYGNATSCGVLTTETGAQWFYTMQNEYSEGLGWLLESSVINVMDEHNKTVGSVNVEIPEGMICNDVQVHPTVTTKFFDFDESSKELMVVLHTFDQEYNQYYITQIYEIGTSSPRISYNGFLGLFFNDYTNSWTRTQRMVIEREDEENVYLDVYTTPGWGDTEPVLMHTFTVATDLIFYSEFAPYFNIYMESADSGAKQLRYIVSHYQQTYMLPQAEEDYYEDPVAREDNNFMIEVFNADFEPVETVKIPVEQREGFPYTFYGFGAFSYDDFTSDLFAPGHNYIITKQSYIPSSDDFLYSFVAYDAEGNPIRSIAQDAINWKKLFDVKDASEQYVFLMEDAFGEQHLEMVDFPSCEVAAYFPSVVDDNPISFNFDRYIAPESSQYPYCYVFSMAMGDVDDEGNVISSIGWFNPDCTVDHYDYLNQGKNCEYFEAYIYGRYLSPWVFNTDNNREYFGAAKITKPAGVGTYTIFRIFNDKDKMLYQFGGTEGLDYNYGMVLNDNQLCLIFVDENYDILSEIYSLPLASFMTGGTGTPDDPYLVATPGDLALLSLHPTASYRQIEDIDLSMVPESWTPIADFNGDYNGDGYTISNLYVDDTSLGEAALFASVTGVNDNNKARIRNLVMESPTIVAGKGAGNVAFVAAYAVNTDFDNIRVSGGSITSVSPSYATVGGIVSSAVLSTRVNDCYVDACEISMDGASSVGGIAGDLRTGSGVTSCVFKGSLEAASAIGGIVGTTVTRNTADIVIRDCHVDADIKGKNTIGGILGEGRPGIYDCYVEGTLQATNPSVWGGLSAGGVVGYLDRDWSYSAEPSIVEGCVVALSSILTPDGCSDTVHRIVGNSVVDEAEDEGGAPEVEAAIRNNYALDTLIPFDAEIGGDNNASTEGASIAADLINKAFLESLGFKFGTSTDAPWVLSGATPSLWFEQIDNVAVELDKYSVTLHPEETVTIVASVVGRPASHVRYTIPSIVSLVSVDVDDENSTVTLTIAPVANGDGAIEIRLGNFTVSAEVHVEGLSGIEDVTSDSCADIRYDGSSIFADGMSIAVYSLDGTLMLTGNDTVSVESLSPGIYVARAINPSSLAANTLKFTVK